MPPLYGSVAQSVEPSAGFAAFVRVGEDQIRIRLHGVDDSIRVSANGLAADHGSIVSGREGWGGVRPVGDVFSGMMRRVDECEPDPWFRRLVPAHGSVELDGGFGMLSLSQSHAVREACKPA